MLVLMRVYPARAGMPRCQTRQRRPRTLQHPLAPGAHMPGRLGLQTHTDLQILYHYVPTTFPRGEEVRLMQHWPMTTKKSQSGKG